VVLLSLQDDALHVALLRRSHAPFKDAMALPGGYVHVDADTDARAAAERVLAAKTGVRAPYLEQLATFSGSLRDPRGWSVSIAYYALVAGDVAMTGRPGALQHCAVDHLPALAFDHRQIIDTAVARLRSKSQYSSLPCYLAGAQFTLPQLQRIYETLMGEKLNKVSFRRKTEEMGMLEAVPGEFKGGAFRPAQLYRLKSEFAARPSLLERGL
jgi:8-oxo-dGTP diphosphatase